MEGGDLRASFQRALRRPLSLLAVAIMLVSSLVLASPLHANAATKHAPVHVPRLIGLSRARVFAVMRADGLYFQTRGPGSSTGSWVSVVAETPPSGTVVSWHSQVTLTTTLQSPTGPRKVPKLVGLSRAKVYAAMRRASLYFRTVGPGSSTSTWVVALHQSPPAGSVVKWHAEVVIDVSTHRLVIKPSLALATQQKPKPKPKPVVRVTTTTTSTTTTVPPTTTTTYPGETTSTSSATSTTTTTVPVTTTTVKKKPVRYRVGIATWYSYIPGHCATWFRPMGTHLTILDLATGKTVHCVVTDREGARGNRVVDLAQPQFSELAPLAQGVILVKVSW
jgi:hypothetical protein